MSEEAPLSILCITSYEKGAEFMRACKRLGCTVYLLTVTALDQADWPRASLDDVFYMPDLSDLPAVTNAVTYLARTHVIDRIVALDDYDVETAAALREHMRLPGMGISAARLVRDKLAMRVAAHAHRVPVPDFVPILNHNRIRSYMDTVPPPWVLKPRSEASTIGITKLNASDELWPRLDALGDRQSHYLLERYVPGDVFHVDSLLVDGSVVFAEAHRYGRPPLDVFHGGGMFVTQTLRRGSDDRQALLAMNRQAIAALGMARGATHAEFIKGQDGRFFFLEMAGRVGGAHIVDVVEAATGINLWAGWAAIEIAGARGEAYVLPRAREEYGGAIISLARQEYPNTSGYQDPEIVWRMNKRHHAGFVLASPDPDRVAALLDDYTRRFTAEFMASLPPWEGRPPSGE
jgi:biotin carboxylase